MKEDLLKLIEEFDVTELYFLEETIPTYIIVSVQSESLLKKIGEMEEIEADIITLTPDEKEALKFSPSEISKVVINVMEKGERLI
ncbi:MAG TPA: hypothetical protein PK411_03930 [Mesotoga infera]|jgi:hypothetical protein|uniref:Uncharacterized protein n=1 Tax=Mesotoga infera TaxID=1236046 RepID=A0A7Z7LGE1_9BACT|nr:hypothetical protein [Mesotoga infera]MBP8660142.1 hypothetical protein [Mesotoga sp.]NLI07297.1 hypothetical protein [Thermotogaceae bacterium]SSC13604.1 conserved protein of unknown function [Mesotoga infera]HNR78617.1 hypothetical protein [Mesotoga infera]HNS66783.1 hypothetical protein [Mesotoga infera]